MNKPTIDAEALTKHQRSTLVYAETCLVDQGGLLQAVRMNEDDYTALKFFAEHGLLQFGRIPFKTIPTLSHGSAGPFTHWVTFTDAGWALASVLRRRVASFERPNRAKVNAALAESTANEQEAA